jgi:hypothetical protein
MKIDVSGTVQWHKQSFKIPWIWCPWSLRTRKADSNKVVKLINGNALAL